VKKSTTLSLQDAAADALVPLLPSATAITWAHAEDGASLADQVGSAVVATQRPTTAANNARGLAE
jgi:hypothetical protein